MYFKALNSALALVALFVTTSVIAEPIAARQGQIDCKATEPRCPDGFFCCDLPTTPTPFLLRFTELDMNLKAFNTTLSIVILVAATSIAAKPMVARQEQIPCRARDPEPGCPDGFFCCDSTPNVGNGFCLADGQACR
ncbi:hypothetical protein K435DRAFT_869643 [Dendrothele bispora CBS 962.96]|uniref:Granulins domain-containing protein n=1 Tax=Dendrothele bispora (strain CBS 962.96) TaxID=1314807 RepID=A0A4S8L9Y6_DENBC|nr:hypothetical protein K435DRAFT_869643 [Dendrothele bispora CBS 962.96]